MKINKMAIIFTSVCIGFVGYPIVNHLREVLEDKPIELSGSAASFFSEYLAPSQSEGDIFKDYEPFYGHDDGKAIMIFVKNPLLSHEDFYKSKRSREMPEFARKKLVNAYCNSVPMSFLYQAKTDGKTIQISYYDQTKQSLFFSVAVGPKSCST
ncbi:ubiquitin family protein [Serratia sp. D1N4]